MAPAAGGLAIGCLVHFFLSEKRPHGVADVIEATANNKGDLSLRDGLASASVSAVSIGVGASVGREGPVVHLLASIASFSSRLFRLDTSTKLILVGCGAASAVAASFNAPIAGAFFAIEVVVGYYSLGAFLPVVISSVIGTTIARLHLGDYPAFVLTNTGLTSYWELPLFLLLGAVCAAVAIVYMAGCLGLAKIFQKIRAPKPLVLCFGGLLVGGIAVFFPEVIGVGYETTSLALSDGFSEGLLFVAMLVAAKTFASALSFGAGFGGGVFSPSLCIGALTGLLFGSLIVALFPTSQINPEAYSIVAMGAVAGAVLGAPISTFLMIFELTKNFNLTIAVMVSTVLASLLVRQTIGHSFFSWQLKLRGVDLSESPHNQIIKSAQIPLSLLGKNAVFTENASTHDIASQALGNPTLDLFICDKCGTLKGWLGKDTIKSWLTNSESRKSKTLEARAISPTHILETEATLEKALQMFKESNLSCLPVVDTLKSKHLVGVLYYQDILSIYNRHLASINQRISKT